MVWKLDLRGGGQGWEAGRGSGSAGARSGPAEIGRAPPRGGRPPGAERSIYLSIYLSIYMIISVHYHYIICMICVGAARPGRRRFSRSSAWPTPRSRMRRRGPQGARAFFENPSHKKHKCTNKLKNCQFNCLLEDWARGRSRRAPERPGS